MGARMTRVMFDATHDLVPNIPRDAQLVAGYLPPSPFAWTAADWARFPNAVHVRIAVRASTDDGHVLDVETGDATPAQAPGWVVMRRAAGADPSVYCSTSLWPTVRAAFAAAGVAEPHWWVAAYPGGGAIIPAGAVAHQYMDAGIYDKSVVADYWPGVDQGGNVSGPVDLTPAATNAVWMQQCQVVWPKGSANATAALAQGAVANADGSVTEVHPAAVWLTVLAGREALEQPELAALQSGLTALQASTAQVDADVKSGDAGLASQLATLQASVEGIAKSVAAIQPAATLPAGNYTLTGDMVLTYGISQDNPFAGGTS